MVARYRGYYGPTFKGYHRVTQGYPLYTKLFNVVMDAVIRHWVAMAAATEEGIDGLNLSIQDLVAYFYSDNGLIASTQPERTHQALNILTGLFDKVGLRTNTEKMMSMACQTCHTPVIMSVEAYERLTTGIGPTFWELQRMQVQYTECRVEVATGSLLTRRQRQNGVDRGYQGEGTAPRPYSGDSKTHRVSFMKRLLRLRFMVEGCLGGASNRTNLRVNFALRHVRDTVLILEWVNRPYPW